MAMQQLNLLPFKKEGDFSASGATLGGKAGPCLEPQEDPQDLPVDTPLIRYDCFGLRLGHLGR